MTRRARSDVICGMSTGAHLQHTAGRLAAMHRIAVAVDASPEGRDAIVLAQALAEAADADVLLLAIEPDMSFVLPYADWAPMRKETHVRLAELRDELASDALIAIDRDRSTARGIERVMRHHRCDLLAVGSGHRSDDGLVSIGHTTRQLMHDLSHPLAIAPRGLAGRGGFALRRIAVGFDDGPQAHVALTVARRLAEHAGAELVVRGVVDDRMPGAGWAPAAALRTFAADWDAAIDKQVADLKDAIHAATRGARCRVTEQVTRAFPASELVSLSGDVDLIVVGSRRWGVAARLLLGGTGEALGRGSRAPLLVVPAVGEHAAGGQ